MQGEGSLFAEEERTQIKALIVDLMVVVPASTQRQVRTSMFFVVLFLASLPNRRSFLVLLAAHMTNGGLCSAFGVPDDHEQVRLPRKVGQPDGKPHRPAGYHRLQCHQRHPGDGELHLQAFPFCVRFVWGPVWCFVLFWSGRCRVCVVPFVLCVLGHDTLVSSRLGLASNRYDTTEVRKVLLYTLQKLQEPLLRINKMLMSLVPANKDNRDALIQVLKGTFAVSPASSSQHCNLLLVTCVVGCASLANCCSHLLLPQLDGHS